MLSLTGMSQVNGRLRLSVNSRRIPLLVPVGHATGTIPIVRNDSNRLLIRKFWCPQCTTAEWIWVVFDAPSLRLEAKPGEKSAIPMLTWSAHMQTMSC